MPNLQRAITHEISKSVKKGQMNGQRYAPEYAPPTSLKLGNKDAESGLMKI